MSAATSMSAPLVWAALWDAMDAAPKGWYWVAGWSSGVPNKNTCQEPCASEAEAKKAAREYVVANMPSNPMYTAKPE